MNAIAIIIFALGFLYASLIALLARGWWNLTSFVPANHTAPISKIFVSIIIAARNEERNIRPCLHDLLSQDFPSEYFEIIVVDDHSCDDTMHEVQKIHKEHHKVKLISLAASQMLLQGKKAAIASGVEQANGELIITTDADCRFPSQWLTSIVAYYQQHHPVMISAPVVFMPQRGLWGKFMELEFISLVASGAGALGLKKPLMCNGANLAFRRDVFFELNPFKQNEKWASGDDLFLMHSIRKNYGSGAIHFLKSSSAIVKTQAPASLKEFILQRLRWSSKTKAYPNSFNALLAILVFLNALFLLIGTHLLIFHPGLLIPVVAVWILKLFSDFLLLYPAASFFGRRKLLLWYIPFQLLHVVYVVATGFWMNVAGFSWKKRKYGSQTTKNSPFSKPFS